MTTEKSLIDYCKSKQGQVLITGLAFFTIIGTAVVHIFFEDNATRDIMTSTSIDAIIVTIVVVSLRGLWRYKVGTYDAEGKERFEKVKIMRFTLTLAMLSFVVFLPLLQASIVFADIAGYSHDFMSPLYGIEVQAPFKAMQVVGAITLAAFVATILLVMKEFLFYD